MPNCLTPPLLNPPHLWTPDIIAEGPCTGSPWNVKKYKKIHLKHETLHLIAEGPCTGSPWNLKKYKKETSKIKKKNYV